MTHITEFNKERLNCIVLNYNDPETTIKFIISVSNISNIDRIIIVDNNSSDDSVNRLSKLTNDRIELIQCKENKGYAAGNNFGAIYSINKYNPRYILFCNPDVTFDSETIENLLNAADELDNFGTLTCRMICTGDVKVPDCWRLPTYKDCIRENFIVYKHFFGDKKLYKNYYGTIMKVDVVAGSLFLIKSSTFNNVGGFDEDTFLYYEENILAYKLKKEGYYNYILNNVSYLHEHNKSIGKNVKSVKKRLEISNESKKIYCKKYLKAGPLKIALNDILFKIGLNDYLIALKLKNANVNKHAPARK